MPQLPPRLGSVGFNRNKAFSRIPKPSLVNFATLRTELASVFLRAFFHEEPRVLSRSHCCCAILRCSDGVGQAWWRDAGSADDGNSRHTCKNSITIAFKPAYFLTANIPLRRTSLGNSEPRFCMGMEEMGYCHSAEAWPCLPQWQSAAQLVHLFSLLCRTKARGVV